MQVLPGFISLTGGLRGTLRLTLPRRDTSCHEYGRFSGAATDVTM